MPDPIILARTLLLVTLAATAARCALGAGDALGPIKLPSQRVVITPGAVEMPGYRYVRPSALPANRTSSWIWLPGSPPAGTMGLFRRTFELKGAPARADAWISADRHYRLYVNGALVSRGPADPGADYPGGKSRGDTGITYCDYRDLSPWLHAGANVLAVEVFADRISDWYGASDARGLFFEARIAGRQGAALRLGSDASWRSHSAGYFDHSAAPLTYRPELEPTGWRLSSFDDSAWSFAALAGDHWPELTVSELPPPMEAIYPPESIDRATAGSETAIDSKTGRVSATIVRDGSFAIRYPRVLAAFAGLRVHGGLGATLTLGMNEVDAPGGRRSAAIRLTGERAQFETPFYSSFTVLNVEARHVTQPIVIEELRAIFTSMPVACTGQFECSDPNLTALWSASRWALELCQQDHHLDSPDHQEPICDPGDYLIEALINYCAFGQPELARQDLRKYGALLRQNHYITFHTSYALLWLQMLLDYTDYTGDNGLAQELAPTVEGLLAQFESWRGRNGLISEAPDYMFMDWVNIAGIGCHHPPAVIGQGYMTALYYRALADGARVARLVSRPDLDHRYTALRKEVAVAFERELWSSEKQRYRDGKPFQTSVKPGPWLPADTDIETFSPHVSTLAVLYDLAPPERQAALMKRVMADKPLNCQPYFYHFVLSALAHCGLFDTLGPAAMSRWRINPVTATFQEMWDTGDWSHAWGGTPLYQLSSRVLGITPLATGFSRIGIAPTLCGLAWAKGAVPTPHGIVRVAWRVDSGGMTLDVQVPPGASADLTLPLGRFDQPHVRLDGRPAALPGAMTGLRPGRHQVTISGVLLPPGARP